MVQTNTNLTQVNTWKENLLKVKAEKEEKARKKQEMLKRMKESGELYDIMVSDAVFLITSKFNEDTKSGISLYTEKNGIVTLTIYKAFFITSDLNLYSGCYPIPMNPKTGKQCFFNPYQFKDEEEIKKYLNDVKSQLPEDVKIKGYLGSVDGIFEGSIIYDVEVEIDLNS